MEKEENNQKISKNVFGNIIMAVIIMIYYMIINLAYDKIAMEQVLLGLKVLSMAVLAISIIIIEIAYKKDSGKIAINGIEILVIASHTLSIAHVVEIAKFDFSTYILASSYVFATYYIFKAIIVYTNEKREYLKSLSDISEILENEPIKKEATKKKKV